MIIRASNATPFSPLSMGFSGMAAIIGWVGVGAGMAQLIARSTVSRCVVSSSSTCGTE